MAVFLDNVHISVLLTPYVFSVCSAFTVKRVEYIHTVCPTMQSTVKTTQR